MSCDTFPDFIEWPRQKLYFLDNMSINQAPEATQTNKSTYVVIPKEKDGKLNTFCSICSESFYLTFNLEEEEWVYNDSKEDNGVVYHYPLCYEVAQDLIFDENNVCTSINVNDG